ncbi:MULTISPECIES: hypothetical protein [unclassified Rhizobium]|uniref:hypothetical protein n=1 Tax=unclassified Rhizobium TaxID=2613769 RepID=UPI001C83E146|nr:MULTISPECIES: hypothetical protein [unclassified Rhizobium]MBX5165280.1 hypothetical protein [Rhizobium sp. NZLR4b]MBX5185052.1 hypothetical protein [Rhizobium sp. NZLR5]MBX5208990.1 hypothetical protein [Rhizobium sp. NZLR11]
MPEISPPYVRTELTGAAQAADPRAMPLSAYIAEVMAMLEHGNHPRGELVLGSDQARRWAERDCTNDSIFAAMNPLWRGHRRRVRSECAPSALAAFLPVTHRSRG